MNTTLIWLLAITFCIGLVLFLFIRNKQNGLPAAGIFTLTGVIVVLIAFFAATGAQTWDYEIWNGKVVTKDREHGTYEESYQCNCRTVTKRNSDGTTSTSTECDTCYRTHYTVEWTAKTTVGEFQIEKLDRLSRSVYSEPDPDRYTVIKPGDPAAKRNRYTNYVQAVPNSLFTPAAEELKKKFAGLIPKYPDHVYDFYKVDHFLSPGWSFTDASLWNADLANALRDLGGKKQVNLIVVVAKTDDPNYEYALRDAWEGANKNDVVLIIGSKEYPKIDFVRVLSWTKNEAFKVQLRDAITDMGTVSRENIIKTCADQIDKNFERRHMKEFSYLDNEIDPPGWVIYMLIALLIGGAIGVYVFIQKQRF